MSSNQSLLLSFLSSNYTTFILFLLTCPYNFNNIRHISFYCPFPRRTHKLDSFSQNTAGDITGNRPMGNVAQIREDLLINRFRAFIIILEYLPLFYGNPKEFDQLFTENVSSEALGGLFPI